MNSDDRPTAMTTYVATFEELAAEMVERAHHFLWCNMATADARGRPRSRVVHPVWDTRFGWLGARRSSFKGRHLARNPWVSLAYIADLAQPLYIDCHAEWADDLDDKRYAWELFLAASPPAGYDPAPIYVAPEEPNFGLLELTPWRVQLVDAPTV